MLEPRALMKESGRRKDNCESGKDMGEIEIFVMVMFIGIESE